MSEQASRLYPSRSLEMHDDPVYSSIQDRNAISENSQFNLSSAFAPASKLEQSKLMSKPMDEHNDSVLP